MLFFSRRRLPAEAAMPSISATAVPILAFRIVFRPRLYSITQKSGISYAPATAGDRQRWAGDVFGDISGEGRQGTPLCGSACSPTTDRMQFGCGLDAVSLRLMQLCIQAGYSSDAVQKLSRHSRCGSVCGPNTVMNASECAPDAAQSGSARSPDTIRMRIW